MGVVIAVIAGFASAPINAATAAIAGYVRLVIVILGLIVGFLNIGTRQTNDFLLASIAVILMGTANLSVIPLIGRYLENMVLNIAAFVTPAALVVGLKAVYVLASKPPAAKK